jgi:hypothetical protein
MENLKKIKQDGYYISTPEFALMLNISTEALRSRRRRGELRANINSMVKSIGGKACVLARLRRSEITVPLSATHDQILNAKGAVVHTLGVMKRYTRTMPLRLLTN